MWTFLFSVKKITIFPKNQKFGAIPRGLRHVLLLSLEKMVHQFSNETQREVNKSKHKLAVKLLHFTTIPNPCLPNDMNNN